MRGKETGVSFARKTSSVRGRRNSFGFGDARVTSAVPVMATLSWRAIATVAARNTAQLRHIKAMSRAIMGTPILAEKRNLPAGHQALASRQKW